MQFWMTRFRVLLQLIAITSAIIALFAPSTAIGEAFSNSLIFIWLVLAISAVVDLRDRSRQRGWLRGGVSLLTMALLLGILVVVYQRLSPSSDTVSGSKIPLRVLILQVHRSDPDLRDIIQEVSPNLVVAFADPGVTIGPQSLSLTGYTTLVASNSHSSAANSGSIVLSKIPIIESLTDLGLDADPVIVVRLAPGDESTFQLVVFNTRPPWNSMDRAVNRLVQRRSMLQFRHTQQPVLVIAALKANALTLRGALLQEAGGVSQLLTTADLTQLLTPLAGSSQHVSIFERGIPGLTAGPNRIDKGGGFSVRVVTNG